MFTAWSLRERSIFMKILHCADLHIDSRMNTNFDAEKRKKRKAEILNTYRRMIEYAAE